MAEDTSYHHLYYSAHADPVEELEKLNKPPPCIKLRSPTKDGDGAFQSRQLCEEESGDSLARPAGVQVVGKETSCCSCCCVISVFCCILMGFLGGLSLGVLAYRHGHGSQLESLLSVSSGSDLSRSDLSGQLGLQDGQPGRVKCRVRLTGEESSSVMETCAHCLNTRVVNVSNAWYADCNGLYTLTNLTSVWDPKRVVYERIQGGINPQDKRYIYWNSHFYGPNFYGWSIGDKRSLTESGPFHAQGREGVSTQAWLGSWGDNVTVRLATCRGETHTVRFNKQKIDELVRRSQEKEQ